MYCLRENVAPIHINLHLELRALISKGLIKDMTNATGNAYVLAPEALTLIQQVEDFFKISKKKTTTHVMGTNYQDNIETYNNLFPKLKLPSGKPARSDKKNIETAFVWFFSNYNYSWETIIRATARYVDDYESRNFMYMQTSQYFIRKQQSDKSWGSELANWCSVVENNDAPEPKHFSEKVV